MNFAERLKELRKARKLSQGDVAKVLGVTRPAISQYEAGIREPSYEMLEVLADYFNVDMDYLLGRTDKTTTIAVPTSGHQTGYYNPETAKAAQEMLDDPDLHALMDAARDARPEYVKSAIQLLKTLKETNPDG